MQHPREREVPINTARIAALCLPEAHLSIGLDFSQHSLVQQMLASKTHPPVLLYPGPEAKDLRTEPPEGPVTLVLLDGTWTQAKKLLQRNPMLATLPRYGLQPTQPSSYRIRKEPEEHCVSTIEALGEVLALLERNPSLQAALQAPFHAMVETQLAFARTFHEARTRHAHAKDKRARKVRSRPTPHLLKECPEKIVLAYGEANAWPYDERANAPPVTELLHWVAERPATCERFESVLCPVHPLAPRACAHARIAEERVRSGETFSSFSERWKTFFHSDDVLCTWGSYPVEVLQDLGLAPSIALDLRPAAGLFLGQKTGGIESCAREHAAWDGRAFADGRAGERLAALHAIARWLGAPG